MYEISTVASPSTVALEQSPTFLYALECPNKQTDKKTRKGKKTKTNNNNNNNKKKNGEITSSFLRLTRDSNNVLLKTSVYIHSVHVMVLPVKICMAPERVTHKSLNRQTTKF